MPDYRGPMTTFVSLFDFARRVDLKRVEKRPLEMLARQGPLTCWTQTAAAYESLEGLVSIPPQSPNKNHRWCPCSVRRAKFARTSCRNGLVTRRTLVEEFRGWVLFIGTAGRLLAV